MFITFFLRKLDAIHDFAREGDTENLIKCVEAGIPIVRVGPLCTRLLIVGISNLKRHQFRENEGQTPLHYAAV
ncbi:hypothetical protein Hanom_Chr12g01098321 [Helianthus anomalus]